MADILSKSNYLNKEITFLKNVLITEFDLQAASLSVIKKLKLLPESEIDYISKLPKKARVVKVGLEIKKNPELGNKINTEFERVRREFISRNNISTERILSIKKDAIFTINESPTILEFDGYTFVRKNVYTSYFYANGKEFYYNSITNTLDVKGVSEETRKYHRDYLFKDISKILLNSEKFDNRKTVYNFLKTYRNRYLSKSLNPEIYREVDSEMFRFKDFFLADFRADMFDELDISQNYIQYILPLIQNILK